MFSAKACVRASQETRVETVEEFLARGGKIRRIEHYPDPEGRVLLRGCIDQRARSDVDPMGRSASYASAPQLQRFRP